LCVEKDGRDAIGGEGRAFLDFVRLRAFIARNMPPTVTDKTDRRAFVSFVSLSGRAILGEQRLETP